MSTYNKAVKYLRDKYGEAKMQTAFNSYIPNDYTGIDKKDVALHLLMGESIISIPSKRELDSYWENNFEGVETGDNEV